MRSGFLDALVWVGLGLGCCVAVALLVVGVLVMFNPRRTVTAMREAWERGNLRTPDGQFKMIPTLSEARKFAGARGEPLVTCDPVVLDPERDDPLDLPASSGSLLTHGAPPAPPPGSGIGGPSWKYVKR